MSDLAKLLTAMADAHNAAASTLRQHATALSPQLSDGRSLSAVERARIQHPQLGPRQADVIELLEPMYPQGTSAGDIARKMGQNDPANAYLTLQELIKRRFVEKDETTRPHQYRLHPDFMPNEE